jgi:hypothetical protein
MSSNSSCFLFQSRIAAALALACGGAHAQTLDVHYDGDQGSSRFGACVGSGFDLDKDGCDDVVVGIPYEDANGVSYAGTVRVMSGKTHALLLEIKGTLGSYSQFGATAALVGDVDGDGVCDVVIGAPGYSSNAGYVGAFSGANGNVLWYIVGGAGAQLGASVSAAGDVDHDGHMDVLAGAPGANTVYLYGWNTGVLHSWNSTQSGAGFGTAICGNADVDGDGTMDVIIGVPFYDSVVPFRLNRGRVDVYSGSTYAAIFFEFGDGAGDNLGMSVAALPRWGSHGHAQVLAGAPQAMSGAGLVREYDWLGNPFADFTNPYVTGFGTVITGCGDIDRDGFSDFAVSSEPSPTSIVEWFSGGFSQLAFTFQPDANAGAFGYSLASGDVDGDGASDLVIGDAYHTVNSISVGGVDVFRAVPASTTDYGTGWPGELGVPTLTTVGKPGLGFTFDIDVSDSRSQATTAIFFAGVNRANLQTSKGGTLLVAPYFSLVFPVPPAGSLWSLSFAPDPALIGVQVDLQVVEVDPLASKGLSFTAGLELLLGIG